MSPRLKLRLIDAEKLKRKIKYVSKTYGVSELTRNKLLNAVDDSIVNGGSENQGNWIITPNGVGRNINTGEMSMSYKCDCNICGFHTGNQGLKFHYCPNCGAKMDGGNEDD